MPTQTEKLATAEYAELARIPLEPKQCALVVVDIQQKLLPPIFQKEQLVRNAQLLIRAAGILKISLPYQHPVCKGTRPHSSRGRFPAKRQRCHRQDIVFMLRKRSVLRCGQASAGPSQYPATVWHGKSHLRGPNRTRGAARRIFGPHRF